LNENDNYYGDSEDDIINYWVIFEKYVTKNLLYL
jgi:hypothetical protein